MTRHVEWARVSMPAQLVEGAEAAEFTDSFGQGLDDGNVALWIGDYDGTILEGSRTEIVNWLRAALALFDQAGPEPGRDPGDESPAAWVLTWSKLEDLVARPLTDEVVERVAKAIPHSSIPDSLQVIVQAVTDDLAEDDDTPAR